jgi:Protein phosphatase 2C
MVRTHRSRLGHWEIHAGTAVGAGHLARGLPNQDAVAYRDDGPTAVAVADGHGSHRHHRSGLGAAFAVEAGHVAALRLATRVRRLHSPSEVLAMATAALAPEILGAWRRAVTLHHTRYPYSPAERAALTALGDGPEVPYGSTLLVCLVAGRWLVCAQIGDGDLLAVQPDGRPLSPIPPDDRLDGVRTTSLCLPGAEQDFRFGVRDLTTTAIRAVLLATDGYANAQRAEPWQPGVAADLALLAGSRDPGWFAEQIPEWARLCASSAGSGDDTTLALLVNRSSKEGG